MINKVKDIANKFLDKLDRTLYRLDLLAQTMLQMYKFMIKLTLAFSVPIIVLLILDSSISNPKYSVNFDLLDKKYSFVPPKQGKRYLSSVIRLKMKNGGFCSGFVISEHYAISAAHCFKNFDSSSNDEVEFFDSESKTHGTISVAGVNESIDYAILRGDFKKFLALKVRNRGDYITGFSGNFVACGYPAGSKHLTCNPFQYMGSNSFQIGGISNITQGMSGGAVIDMVTGEVLGVIQAVNNNTTYNTLLSPLLGFDAHFGIEE